MGLGSTGARVDAGYTDNDYRVNAFAAGGIPPERIFTLGPNADSPIRHMTVRRMRLRR